MAETVACSPYIDLNKINLMFWLDHLKESNEIFYIYCSLGIPLELIEPDFQLGG